MTVKIDSTVVQTITEPTDTQEYTRKTVNVTFQTPTLFGALSSAGWKLILAIIDYDLVHRKKQMHPLLARSCTRCR